MQNIQKQNLMAKIISLLLILMLTYSIVAERSFVVTPSDLNHNNTLFGGKILSEMDREAGITARRFLYNSKTTKDAVTASIESVKFHKACNQRDLVITSGLITQVGKKTITIQVRVEKELEDGTRQLVAEAIFVFVAYDFNKRSSVEHGLTKEK